MELGARVLACGHCRSRLYAAGRGALSYRLVALADFAAGGNLFHLPFWRVRGLRFRFLQRPVRVEGGLVDLTAPATSLLPAESNLGVRTQTGRLVLCAPPHPSAPADLEHARAAECVLDAVLAEPDLMGSRLIGESRALVYAPFALEREGSGVFLREAFPGGRSAPLDEARAAALEAALARSAPPQPLRFLPLACPNCASPLDDDAGAEALFCSKCRRTWWSDGEKFHPMPHVVLGAPAGTDRLFPFWQISFEAGGAPLASRADLVPWATPFDRCPEAWREEPCSLLVPGFKISPPVFLRLAKAASLFFEEGESEDGRLGLSTAEPVRLPLGEAAQAVEVVLAAMALAKEKRVPRMLEGKVRTTGARLVYVPFERRFNEWFHRASGQSISIATVEHGRRL